MIACFGVRAPHDRRDGVVLVQIGERGRRAFLCAECVVALDEAGVRSTVVDDQRAGRDRRSGPGKRRSDHRLGALAHDRRATWP